MANEAAFEADDFLKNLFGDEPSGDADTMFNNLFSDVSPEESAAKEEAVEPEAETVAAPEAEVEQVAEAVAEPEPEATTAEPVQEETPAKEAEEAKEEVEPVAEESAETESDTTAEAPAETEKDVEADAPAAEEAAAPEPAEPVVEVKVEKKTRRRRTKKTKEPVAKADDLPADKEELDEGFVKSLILVLGPQYEATKKEINEMINNITVQADMPQAVVKNVIEKNNLLEKKLFTAGQGYNDAYVSLTDKDSGLIARIRSKAELTTEGSQVDKKAAGQLAVMTYVNPQTGEKLDLLQYANALKQANNFFSNAKDLATSTSITLNALYRAA